MANQNRLVFLPPGMAVPEIEPDLTAITEEPLEPSGMECKVCRKDIGYLYGGRGAKPQYCEDHKPRKTGGSTAKTTRVSKADTMEEELAASLSFLGLALFPIDAYDSVVVMDRSDDTAKALMDVARKNPRIMKALEQAMVASTWAALATAIAGIAVPIAVHHGVLPLPQSMIEDKFLSPDTIATLREMEGGSTLSAVPDLG